MLVISPLPFQPSSSVSAQAAQFTICLMIKSLLDILNSNHYYLVNHQYNLPCENETSVNQNTDSKLFMVGQLSPNPSIKSFQTFVLLATLKGWFLKKTTIYDKNRKGIKTDLNWLSFNKSRPITFNRCSVFCVIVYI